jgi:hypothetical protein
MSANAHLPLAGVRCCGCWVDECWLVLVLVLLTSSTQRLRHDSSVFT